MIKVFATILVVFAHCSRMYTGLGVVQPAVPSEFLDVLTDLIYAFHMSLFMCVSGMVYGLCIDDFGKYKNSGKFVVNKAKRLLIPYFFFGIFYVAPVMCFFDFTDKSYFDYCLSGIIMGENTRHLWYILALFLIFMLCAVIHRFSDKIRKNHILVFAFLAVLIGLSFLASRVPNKFGLYHFVKYLHFFYAGVVINRYKEGFTKICKNPFSLVAFAAVFAVAFYFEISELSAYSAILLIFGLSDIVSDKFCSNKFYQGLKKNGFGVYLFHPMIIYVLFYCLGKYSINPFVLCFGIFAASYALSYLLTEIMRRIKLGILIGE